jgi:hypothetical protein
MPLLTPGDSHIHHHSLLAGVGAATAAVLVGGLALLGVWHRVSGAVGTAVLVVVWALVVLVVAAAAHGIHVLFLRSVHHARHPETLTRRTIRATAEVVDAAPAALPAPAPAAELPAGGAHYHFDSAEAVEAALRAMTEHGESS